MTYTDVFERNNDTNRIVIDVALNDYSDYFHEWDNSLFKKRDINPELLTFLKDCSNQIPLKEKLELRFNIENEERSEEKEIQNISGYRNYFAAESRALKAHLKALYLSIVKGVVFAIVILIGANLGEAFFPENIVTKILVQGLFIGGWVFMWEAVYTTAYSTREERLNYRKINRLHQADIKFTYNCDSDKGDENKL